MALISYNHPSESQVENAPPLPRSQRWDAPRPHVCMPPLIPIHLSENEGGQL